MEGDWKVWIFKLNITEVNAAVLFSIDKYKMIITKQVEGCLFKIQSVSPGLDYVGCLVNDQNGEIDELSAQSIIHGALHDACQGMTLRTRIVNTSNPKRVPVTPETFKLAFGNDCIK